MTTTAEDIKRTVGQNLRRLRKDLGFLQWQMGEIIGVGFKQVHKYEFGQDEMRAAKLGLLSEALTIPISDFYDSQQKKRDSFILKPVHSSEDQINIHVANRLRRRRQILEWKQSQVALEWACPISRFRNMNAVSAVLELWVLH